METVRFIRWNFLNEQESSSYASPRLHLLLAFKLVGKQTVVSDARRSVVSEAAVTQTQMLCSYVRHGSEVHTEISGCHGGEYEDVCLLGCA
jgi:hypothetical protein